MITNFFFSTIGKKSTPTPIVFDADYIMIKYTFTDGVDLDTRTKMLSPVVSGYLGWSRLSRYPASPDPIILEWGGDNTGAGNVDNTTSEAVLINLINFRAEYPDTPISLDCRAFWYNTQGYDPVILEATLWKGGSIVKGTPYRQFSNPTADSSLVADSQGATITDVTRSSDGERVGLFDYDPSTNIGQFT